MTSPRTVDCPTCKGPSLFSPRNAWRPFCSERCRNADLGAWASESYRVASPVPAEDLPDTPGDPATPH